MKVYTGYYAKLKKYKENNLYPIAISGKRPDFYTGAYWSDFAPRYKDFIEWKSGRDGDIQYTEKYRKWLNSLDKQEIRDVLEELENEYKDIIFLCYEKPGDFCHRHTLADWLEENMGLVVEEYFDGK